MLLLLLMARLVVLLLQCGSSEGQEKAPLYLFEPEIDLSENYGAASGIQLAN